MSAPQVLGRPVPTRTTVRRLTGKRSRQLGKQLIFTEITWLIPLRRRFPSYYVREVALSRQSLM